MILVHKGRVYHDTREAAEGSGWSVEQVQCKVTELCTPGYTSSSWATVDGSDEYAIKAAILATTAGIVFDLEVKKKTSANRMEAALQHIRAEAARSNAYDTEITAVRDFIAKCIETLGYPGD